MKRSWTAQELGTHWTLLSDEHELLANKSGATRLGFALLLKFFQCEGRFPRHCREISADVVAYLAAQVGVSAEIWSEYDFDSRSIKRHRVQIRKQLGFREASIADQKALTAWLAEHVLPSDRNFERLKVSAYERCRASRIEPPAPEQLDRLLRSALHSHESRSCDEIGARLSSEIRARLDAILLPAGDGAEKGGDEITVIQLLRTEPGRPSLESIELAVDRLERIRAIGLPNGLFDGVPRSTLKVYRQRGAVEEPFELRRHRDALRMTIVGAFCHERSREITDTLVDLLVATVHRVQAKSERRVEKELLKDFKRVIGKDDLLYDIAEVSLARPDDSVKEVIYPVAGEQTLRDLLKEAKKKTYRQRVQTVMRASYSGHYRQMLPLLLRTLTFRSNNSAHQPVIRALAIVNKYIDSKLHFYPADEDVPLDGVVKASWRESTVEQNADGTTRVNRLSYEICALSTLREKLRCKEIWVEGADRYRNPDEDLPQDFEEQRETYYAAMKTPRDAAVFVTEVQRQMKAELLAFNDSVLSNPYVRILSDRGGRISLTPLDAQAEPKNLGAVKTEIVQRWPMTSLLDDLKEADLRVGFTGVFKSPSGREHLSRDILQPRLLLCLYGIGTNTGLKRVAAGQDGITYRDLLYVRRRFITAEHLREVIRRVVNAIFRARQPHIWGEATTSCASDSKKFGAWDQNLMTEWHVRYGGRGVMIYWHVEKNSVCVYSQLKTCSSSEAAAMIQGVLRHCTEMSVEKNYVDTHGQSEVAFAFSRLLGFQLMPRFKAINRQKLYRPEAGQPEAYSNLQAVLSRPIDWDLIAQQYDEMVKYATALRLGTADAEAILRRFGRNNVHPTYKALAELGKAQKTIFLCQYLRQRSVQREVHEGLNVVENWNSANDFICFGKGGEFASNSRDDQEVTMLCLHLLQICLVYINTLMIQRVLTDDAWMQRMTAEDLRALSPLIWGHVTPYGTFRLDMNSRLNLDDAAQTLLDTSTSVQPDLF